ncbi:MAG: hypothetical protein IKQ95_05920 [Synergistaceae bacterium]|nr:hypothetical protein [Synergistaceae bacterium]
MRVYIPFDDGSSISFDGEGFTIQRRPKGITETDNPSRKDNSPCKADIAWRTKWSEIVRALETAYKRQEKAKREQNAKKIYRP